MTVCPICKRNKISVMKMEIPSYYVTGFGIERLEKTEVCPECGTNLVFLSENAGDNVTLEQKNNAVDYFSEVIGSIDDRRLQKVLIDYINQEPYDDPDPEGTRKRREEDLKKTRRKSILMSVTVFMGMGAILFYVSGIINSWMLRLASCFLMLAGAVVIVLPLLKRLTK